MTRSDTRHLARRDGLTLAAPSHVDLYDRLDVIPFDRLGDFFGQALSQ